jgi:hypothetical protein
MIPTQKGPSFGQTDNPGVATNTKENTVSFRRSSTFNIGNTSMIPIAKGNQEAYFKSTQYNSKPNMLLVSNRQRWAMAHDIKKTENVYNKVQDLIDFKQVEEDERKQLEDCKGKQRLKRSHSLPGKNTKPLFRCSIAKGKIRKN